MSELLLLSLAHQAPKIRSRLYHKLAQGFLYPTPAIFQGCRNGEFSAELRNLMASLPHLEPLLAEIDELTWKIAWELKTIDLQDLEVGFVQTFEVGAPQPPCPPYEGLYREGERTKILLEISEFYKHFGLSMNREDGRREVPDHLSAELEFLHFLTFKEAQAEDEKTSDLLAGYLLAEKDFLEHHLTQWVPAFSKKLQLSGAFSLYKHLASITAGVLQRETHYLANLLNHLYEPGPEGSVRDPSFSETEAL